MKHKIEAKKIFLVLYIALATLFLMFTNNLVSFCLSSILLLVFICILLNCDIKHPLILFLIIFILYQIAFPILISEGFIIYERVYLNNNYYVYSWISLISFIIFFGKVKNVTYSSEIIQQENNTKFLKLIYILFATISIVSSIYIIRSGFQSKYELSQNQSIITFIGNLAYTGITPLTMCLILSKNLGKRKKILFYILPLLILFIGMFTYGERSYVFNYLIISIIYYFTLNKIKIDKLLIIGCACVFFLSMSSSLKMLFTSNKYKNTSAENSNIIYDFLNSDFASAGFNFNYVLNNTDDRFYGKTYLYDFLSPIDDMIPSIKEYSSTQWYTNEYWKNRKTGLGFSYLAEGYINFGFVGVIIEMFILARMIKFVYIKSNKSFYSYILYLGFISLAMYSCRESLANIISPFFKYYVLLLLAVLFGNKLKREKI